MGLNGSLQDENNLKYIIKQNKFSIFTRGSFNPHYIKRNEIVEKLYVFIFLIQLLKY